jgi:hypothetical protein
MILLGFSFLKFQLLEKMMTLMRMTAEDKGSSVDKE